VTPNASTGSFRDPSGQVFESDGRIYRQVNTSYAAAYDALMQGGLYGTLVDRSLLIPHVEVVEPTGRPG
jgi:hypothetical protein